MSSELSSPNINTAWFQERLYALEISQTKLGEAMGLDKGAVSLLLRGKRKMSVHEAGQIASVFGVPVDEVLRQAGVSGPQGSSKPRVNVVGSVEPSGRVVHTITSGPRTAIAPPGVDPSCEALRVADGSPLAGWLMFYRPSPIVAPTAIGRLCVVKLIGARPTLVRIVKQGTEIGYYDLTDLLGNSETNARLEWASPVLWMQQ